MTTSKKPTNQTSQQKVVDGTVDDNNDVVLISAMTLSNTACDLNCAAKTLLDLAKSLYLIQTKKISNEQSKALARISCDTAGRWAVILDSQVAILNETLIRTKFGTVEMIQ